MFKVEVFINNVYEGEFPNQYETLTKARLAMSHDSEIYNISEALYLVSYNGRMVELWELKEGGNFNLKKVYIEKDKPLESL